MELMILAIVLLVITVIILYKDDKKRRKENKEIKKNLEVLENIYEKNKAINTGNHTNDFNNSLTILQDYAKRD